MLHTKFLENSETVVCRRIHYFLIFALKYRKASFWENRNFAYAKTKPQINFAVTDKLISAFVFAA